MFTPVASATVKNVEVVNLTSANNAITADVSSWTGVQALSVVSVGAATATAGSAVNVAVTNSAQAANAVAVNGGSGVTVTSTGQTTGTIGVTGAAGAVAVTASGAYADGADVTLGTITVAG